MVKTSAVAVLAFTLFLQPASALPPLHKDPTVVSGFYAIGLADEVRKNCNSISPRMLRAYNFLKSLEKHALKAGYTKSDIKALEDNKAEKNRLRKQIRAELATRGATPTSPEGYCTVGREEIAKGSMAGRLLRAN